MKSIQQTVTSIFNKKCYQTKTWVCSPTHSKANLLTPGSGEGKWSVYCKVPYKKSGTADAQKAQTPCTAPYNNAALALTTTRCQ